MNDTSGVDYLYISFNDIGGNFTQVSEYDLTNQTFTGRNYGLADNIASTASLQNLLAVDQNFVYILDLNTVTVFVYDRTTTQRLLIKEFGNEQELLSATVDGLRGIALSRTSGRLYALDEGDNLTGDGRVVVYNTLDVKTLNSDSRIIFPDLAAATNKNNFVQIDDNGVLSSLPQEKNVIVLNDSSNIYVPSQDEINSLYICENSSSLTIELPNDLPLGWEVDIIQQNTGSVDIFAASGAVVQNFQSHTQLAGQFSRAKLTCVENVDGTSATYNLSGNTA